MDRVGAFLAEKTPRRVVATLVFVGLLYLFRHLAILLLFFVTFERALGFLTHTFEERAKLPRKQSLLLSLVSVLTAVGLLAWLGVGKSIRAYTTMHQAFPERIAELREHPLFEKLHEHVGGTERIVEGAKHYASNALGAAEAIGHFFIYI